MSLRDYVRDLRLHRAHLLQLASPLSLTAIAAESGFYDLPHLDKAFRHRLGVSPLRVSPALQHASLAEGARSCSRCGGQRLIATMSRKSGIDVVGAMPWGTHFRHFYEPKDDLLDTLVPYFKAGLDDGEFCVWVVSEPLTEAEAWIALGRAVPDLARHVADGSIAGERQYRVAPGAGLAGVL